MRGGLCFLCLVKLMVCSSQARAEDAGLRDFPATLVVEEPQVETEISPQIAHWIFGGRQRSDVSSELALQLTKSFGIILSPLYTGIRPGGGGFQPFGAGVKYQFVANAEHEFVFSAGLLSTIGGTGSPLVGADPQTTLIPTIYYGKGAGDLPESLAWARPLALTGQVGLSVPTRVHSSDTVFGLGFKAETTTNYVGLNLQGSLQYNLGYAAANVFRSLSKEFHGLVPIVEYDLQLPLAPTAAHVPVVGTINPGFLLVDPEEHLTIGVEALLPVDRASGNHPGFRLQASYSFDPPWRLAGRAPR